MSEHKIMQREIEKNSSYVLDKIKSGFIFFDSAGRILYANQYFSNLLKKSLEELKNQKFTELLNLKSSLIDHLQKQSNIEFTKTLIINDNEFLFNISISYIDNDSKLIFGYMIINSLSSMEKQVDDLLMRELDTRDMLNDSLIGIFTVDYNHRIIQSNNTFCSLLGYLPYEIHNQYSWKILNDYSKETILSAYGNMVDATNIVETNFIKKSGELIKLRVMGKGGKIKGEPVMIYFVDTFPKE